MAFWLLKSEPAGYGSADLVRDGATEWDGVRSHAAANDLRSVAAGDRALIYHAGAEKAALAGMPMLRQSRLSVSPVSARSGTRSWRWRAARP